MVTPQFQSYIGIDYSGAQTRDDGLEGIRVFMGNRRKEPIEVLPMAGVNRHWTRRTVAEWLAEQLIEAKSTLVGIDHGFSFPFDYFVKHRLGYDWDTFLDDFQKHWPTDAGETPVDFILEGKSGNGAARMGNPEWLRMTEKWTSSANSIFLFEGPDSAARSAHAGLPWIRYVRRKAGAQSHFWPFDGWDIVAEKNCVVEVHPSLFSRRFANEGRDAHQQDAFAVAKWLRSCDEDGSLSSFFKPYLKPNDRKVAQIEGWILGVM